MNLVDRYGIQVKHGGSDITNHVISYTWNKKVCSSIGVATIVIENSIINSIGISDEFTIYEDDSLVFTCFVTKTTDNYQGTSTIELQDRSKYLVDYFIAETYLIDYASYSRTWIEQFLTDAQVSYSFLVSDNGTLLSNNTSLGLASAYDQIMNLLQMNGWYMEFTPSGVAVIGKLTSTISSETSINEERILQIEVIRDDRLLRNRGVVWGNADPNSGIQVYADIYRPTPWDIDSNDKRAFVVTNSNVPNSYVAGQIANMGLDAFAKITEEKHIVVESLLSVSFATRVIVQSRAFNGAGIVTTYGTSCDSSGLKTIIILDERCPRLFGSFYDFGDFVYVGTDGSGVWRKQLESGIWYNFSNQINDLHISDLHKSKDLMVCVTVSGESYRTYGGYADWIPIPITGLSVHEYDTTVSGTIDSNIITSGIMVRACTIDKTTNDIRLLVDNMEGGNDLYDYTMQAGEIAAATSGIGSRAWVLDYTANGLLKGQYPVTTNGSDFIYAGADIDNSGANDYISVAVSGTTVFRPEEYIDRGMHTGGIWFDSTHGNQTALIDDYTYAGHINMANIGEWSLTNISSVHTPEHYQLSFESAVVEYVNGTLYGNSFTYPANYADAGSYYLGNHITRFYFLDISAGEVIYVDFDFVNNTLDGPTTVIVIGPHLVVNAYFPYVNSLLYNGCIYLSSLVYYNQDPEYPLDYYSFVETIYKIDMETATASIHYQYDTGTCDIDTQRFVMLSGFKENAKAGALVVSNGAVRCVLPHVRLDIEFMTTCNVTFIEPGSGTYLDLGVHDNGYFWGVKEERQGHFHFCTQINRGNFYSSGDIYLGSPDSGTFKWILNSVDFYYDVADITTSCSVFTMDSLNKMVRIETGPTYYYTDVLLGLGEQITITEDGYTLIFLCSSVDTDDDSLLAIIDETSTGTNYLAKLSSDGTIVSKIALDEDAVFGGVELVHGGWYIEGDGEFNQIGLFGYDDIYYSGVYSKILRRDGAEYTEIYKRMGVPYRLEISQNNPLIAFKPERNMADSRVFSLIGSGYMYPTLTNPDNNTVYDLKYTWRQQDYISDSMFSLFYTTSGIGMRMVDMTEITSSSWDTNFLDAYTDYFTESGLRFLETTNYKYPYQYIFVATSGAGISGMGGSYFYQQNDKNLGFINYSSGLPDSAITIIRIDDEM